MLKYNAYEKKGQRLRLSSDQHLFFAKDRSGDIKNGLLTPNRLMFKEGLSGELNKPLATGERVAARVLLACCSRVTSQDIFQTKSSRLFAGYEWSERTHRIIKSSYSTSREFFKTRYMEEVHTKIVSMKNPFKRVHVRSHRTSPISFYPFTRDELSPVFQRFHISLGNPQK